jgi:hypothetical protein
VRRHRPPYLRPVWSDAHWQLFAVTRPTPIVAPPGRIIEAGQARIVVRVPAGTTLIRIRWSRFLHVVRSAGTTVRPAARGWVELHARVGGTYVIA